MSDGLSVAEDLVGEVREIRFSFELDGETVPGLACIPRAHEQPMPLVFMQHPGFGSKDDYFVREVALRWATRGWACAGLDAPLHGDRKPHDPLALFRDRARYPEIRAQFARELSASVNHLSAAYPIDTARLGFVGYSLGAMLGVPAVAADGRFRAAAFCLVGEGGLVGELTGDEPTPLAGLSATAVRIVAKTHDEHVSRASTQALFDALPGRKDLVWLPGGHFEIGPDVIRSAEEWLRQELHR